MSTSKSSFSAKAIAQEAKSAFDTAQSLSNGSEERLKALRAIRDGLHKEKDAILAANAKDMEAAKAAVEAGKMSQSLLKRLDLLSSPDKYDSMLQGLLDVADLPDPTGNVTYASQIDDDLALYRVTCPIGVLLVIFEARPEVIANITALAIKSGNAAILKGGKESLHTQAAMTTVIQQALATTSLPSAYIQTVESRDEISSLLEQDEYIDLVIPRGSNALVKSIQHSTRIPVMGHADGLCIAYLDKEADEKKAVRVIVDSKTNYPAACNSLETLLVNEACLSTIWPKVAQALLDAKVTLKCDPQSLEAVSTLSQSQIQPSTPEDYETEFLDLTLAVKTVSDFSKAIKHINQFSSKHTNIIITENKTLASAFVRAVDAAGTFVNASSRFADGFRYGFGTEVGISTGKTHARGPVGLDGLVIYKYIVQSSDTQGSIVEDFEGANKKRKYQHSKLQVDRIPF